MDDLLKVAGDPLDDSIDALRYGLMTWGMTIIQPSEIEIQEAMEGKDPTSAYMTLRQIEINHRPHGECKFHAQTPTFEPHVVS